MHPVIEKFGKSVVIFDGGMGTLLQARGLKGGELPELWNLTHPNDILEIQSAYADAGCDIISSNTFGANRVKLARAGKTVQEIVPAALALARRASAGRAAVALDIGPSGKLLEPYGDLSFDGAYELFREMILAGRDQADLVLIETMSDTYEVKAAMLAAKENCDLPIVVTYTFDENGRLLMGGSIEAAVTLAESLGAAAVGINCSLGPEQMEKFVPRLLASTALPVCINPNAGLPVAVDGRTTYPVTPEEFCGYAVRFAESGAALLGGCCGTTPEHIRLLSRTLRGRPVPQRSVPARTVVSSFRRAVVFGERPILIGERINPTGKPRLKQALREGDFDYLCDEAISQTEHGADILDVNVGLPGIDEAAAMEEAITLLQSVTSAPLQIDTSNIQAMERALRLYNGKPLVNSVNGKAESLHTVLPLVKKYGAAVVALTLDENGIPDTAEERVRIAEKIIRTAEEYGIDRRDILVDTLTMTVSTGAQNAVITLDALDTIRRTLGVHTVLGVSNISFGLPRREIITSAFFTMAMQRGLSAGIVNPLSDELMKAYRAFCALMGLDSGCRTYIDAYAGTVAAPDVHSSAAQPAAAEQEPTLHRAIVKGLCEQAGRLTDEALKHTAPLDIINTMLIPALDEVGQGFERGTVFLPQLLMSADAAKTAFDRIKTDLAVKGVQEKKKGSIILATVKGDIHDIGKNIVKVLLENYGFDVIDLGKDVPPETIVQTAVERNIRIVGLSALMTTTVPSMEETIKQLRKAHDCKVMVGGAVLTAEYAQAIGADFYSKDAMGSVRYAEQVFAENE
ncbi:MAG: homocysteine S-methyltransferase family protein [Hominenteromicrobium sp.]